MAPGISTLTYLLTYIIRRSLHSRFPRTVTAARVQRQVVTAVGVREAEGGG